MQPNNTPDTSTEKGWEKEFEKSLPDVLINTHPESRHINEYKIKSFLDSIEAKAYQRGYLQALDDVMKKGELAVKGFWYVTQSDFDELRSRTLSANEKDHAVK